MDFSNLKEIRDFSGFDRETRAVKLHEWSDETRDCDCVRVIIDGITYEAVEDPVDGYRSNMARFEKSRRKVHNRFPPITVFCIHQILGEYGREDNVLQVLNMGAEIILELGVRNIADYYPSFICNYAPENLV